MRFATLIGTKATHVPYRGGAQALTDLMAGRIDFIIDFLGLCFPQIQAGNVRVFAVIAPGRDPAVPDVPTTQEAGLPQMDSSSWNGLFLPPRVPRDVSVVRSFEEGAHRARRRPRPDQPGRANRHDYARPICKFRGRRGGEVEVSR